MLKYKFIPYRSIDNENYRTKSIFKIFATP